MIDFIILPNGEKHCVRSSGTSLRAWFRSREEAEAFAADPANPAYHGDVAHFCPVCEWFHLSRPEWLAPEWLGMTTESATVQ